MRREDYNKYEEAMDFICLMCAFECTECDDCPVKKTWDMIKARVADETYRLEE